MPERFCVYMRCLPQNCPLRRILRRNRKLIELSENAITRPAGAFIKPPKMTKLLNNLMMHTGSALLYALNPPAHRTTKISHGANHGRFQINLYTFPDRFRHFCNNPAKLRTKASNHQAVHWSGFHRVSAAQSRDMTDTRRH